MSLEVPRGMLISFSALKTYEKWKSIRALPRSVCREEEEEEEEEEGVCGGGGGGGVNQILAIRRNLFIADAMVTERRRESNIP